VEVLLVFEVEDQGEGGLLHPAHGCWQKILLEVWEVLPGAP